MGARVANFKELAVKLRPMHFDTRDALFNLSAIDCDVAIVGAGPAGITLAQSFHNTPYRVCLLESGGFDPDPQVQALANGAVHSPSTALEPDYVSLHSQRTFGGTGSIWGGYCRPLDALDFEQRELPFAHGWPITLDNLKPYYPWDALEGKRNIMTIPGSALQAKYYERVIYPFHLQHRHEFEHDKNIHLVLHATVTDIALDQRKNIAHLQAVGAKQQSIMVKARLFVLASGGIGNVKLLLNANSVEKNGLGNLHDQVGRHFMEHPHFQFFKPPALAWFADKKAEWLVINDRYKPALSLDDAWIREEKLLNFCAMISPALVEDSNFAGAKIYRPHFSPLASTTGSFHTLAFRCEQRPNPASRVMLSADKDDLGLQRIKLDWQLADADHASLLRSIALLAEALGKSSLGRIKLMLDESAPWQQMVGGGHLMGTTRMSEKPEEGVVDANSRVHGKENLYIAGSSVFASSGVANPTLTVMALSRRLGAHLQARLHGA